MFFYILYSRTTNMVQQPNVIKRLKQNKKYQDVFGLDIEHLLPEFNSADDYRKFNSFTLPYEFWLQYPKDRTIYVSNYGRVCELGHMIKMPYQVGNRLKVTLTGGRLVRVDTLIAETFFLPEELIRHITGYDNIVVHKDHNIWNNRIDNLRLVKNSDIYKALRPVIAFDNLLQAETFDNAFDIYEKTKVIPFFIYEAIKTGDTFAMNKFAYADKAFNYKKPDTDCVAYSYWGKTPIKGKMALAKKYVYYGNLPLYQSAHDYDWNRRELKLTLNNKKMYFSTDVNQALGDHEQENEPTKEDELVQMELKRNIEQEKIKKEPGYLTNHPEEPVKSSAKTDDKVKAESVKENDTTSVNKNKDKSLSVDVNSAIDSVVNRMLNQIIANELDKIDINALIDKFVNNEVAKVFH